jgi:hypothetical protein
MKTERVAIAYRLLFAYPFVRPESEQNSSHLQIDCAGSLAIVTLCSVTASFMTCYLRKTTEAPAISTRAGLPAYRAWTVGGRSQRGPLLELWPAHAISRAAKHYEINTIPMKMGACILPEGHPQGSRLPTELPENGKICRPRTDGRYATVGTAPAP